MSDARTLKVLIAGDVNGKFDALLQRVEKVNNSNGPFDVLLCSGTFFDPTGNAAACLLVSYFNPSHHCRRLIPQLVKMCRF